MAEAWQVTGQRQSSLLQGGAFVDAMVVTFTTASGTTGQITVPLSQYTPANVHKLIAERVEAIDAVHSLTSSQPPMESPASAS